MELFSVVVHKFEMAVRFTAKGLVLFNTKVTLEGDPSELPPLYGGLGSVVRVVCALPELAANIKNPREKKILPRKDPT